MDDGHLAWPFFEPRHRERAARLAAWAAEAALRSPHDETVAGVDAASRAWVAALADGGWLDACVSLRGELDVRTLCLSRETLAYHAGLADFAFAMQGLGSGPLSLFGTPAQRARWLPAVARGEAIAAFALTEPEAGSDVAALRATARRDGDGWVLDGEKTWISNGGIADLYLVFARTGEAPGHRGLSAFAVPGDAAGLEVAERLETIAPHPLARLRFDGLRLGADALVGAPGEGFKVAMATLDVFRATVGAAALGFARRALDEALAHSTRRELFGAPLAAMPVTRAKLADMALEVDASALLVYRAAWTKDVRGGRISREAAMAKWHATEAAQRVIDAAVQLHGGRGVQRGSPVENLYREIRALRIYEGATEVQQQIVARQLLDARERAARPPAERTTHD